MSTLIYSVREDRSEQTVQYGQDRRRVRFAVVLVAMAIGPGVFLVDRVAGTTALRSFLAEALSLCLYAAVAVWYALRRRPWTALRAALTIYLVGLAIMGLVDFSTKRGLDTLLVDSPRAEESILYTGVLMLLFVPLLAWAAWRYPVEMNRVGFSRGYSLSRLNLYLLTGLGAGLLIGTHFWLTAKTAGIDLDLKPWPYMVWQLCYEVGPQSLTEELFMRGVIFNALYFDRDWNFWTAALTASSLELLSLLVKQDYSADMSIFLGMVFYTVVSSVVSAGLFRWSRSVVPGYVHNVVFGIASSFR